MISIIGSGKVGSAIAFLTASNSLDDIVLVNRTKSKAVGEALDLTNSIPEGSAFTVSATDDPSQVGGSKAIVIAASYGTYSTSRNELLQDQASMVRRIAGKIRPHAPDSIILMVSNPVDVLTYILLKEGGFPNDRVVGIASSLDTARFRYLLSRELESNMSEISGALVLGEHGDSMVPVFSKARKSGIPVSDMLSHKQAVTITRNLRSYWRTLREHKSRSVFGISKHVFDVLEAITTNKKISIPASVLVSGGYGISDVCLGVPTTISGGGLEGIHESELSASELQGLQDSARRIRGHIGGLDWAGTA